MLTPQRCLTLSREAKKADSSRLLEGAVQEVIVLSSLHLQLQASACCIWADHALFLWQKLLQGEYSAVGQAVLTEIEPGEPSIPADISRSLSPTYDQHDNLHSTFCKQNSHA